MEQKTIKTPVYTNKTIFEQSAEQPIDVDFSLPDYCPDILKILKCRAVSRISSRTMSGRTVTVEGCVTVTCIYTDERNRICAYEYQYPFSKNFEANIDCDGAEIICKTRCEYINCRAVTNRKIDIHGAAGISVALKRLICTEIISDFDEPTTELRRGKAPATSPVGRNEKYIVIEEEIECGNGQPNIRSMIRYDADAAVRECKILAGKVMVKGELVIGILYCGEEGVPQTVRTTLPFSQLLEIDGINDGCECESCAEIAYIDIKPRFSGDGEENIFRMNAKILITSEAYCNNDIDIITDAYSRKYEAEITRCEIDFEHLCRSLSETFSCKKNLDFPENSLCEVCDIRCEAERRSVGFENGTLCLGGTLNACIIAKDCDGTVNYYEKPIDFEYKIPIENCGERMHCEPKITVLSCGYTLNGESSMEIRCELCIGAAVYECRRTPLISDIRTDSNRPVTRRFESAMTVFFAAGGENVWDIARKYGASVEEIKKINEISGDMLEESCMILVPN